MSHEVPLLRSKYRVLVLKDESPANPKLPVLAICLEQNLVGRGRTQHDALLDLARTLHETINYQVESLAPAHVPDPDPRLLAVFEDPHRRTLEGDIVLDRLKTGS